MLLTVLTPGYVTDASFTKNNSIIGIATADSMVYLYSTTKPYNLINSFSGGLGAGNTFIDFSFDSTTLLVCGGTNGVKLFSLSTYASTTIIINGNMHIGCEFANNGNFVVISDVIEMFSASGSPIWLTNIGQCTSLDLDDSGDNLVALYDDGSNDAYIFPSAATTSSSDIILTSDALISTVAMAPDASWTVISGD